MGKLVLALIFACTPLLAFAQRPAFETNVSVGIQRILSHADFRGQSEAGAAINQQAEFLFPIREINSLTNLYWGVVGGYRQPNAGLTLTDCTHCPEPDYRGYSLGLRLYTQTAIQSGSLRFSLGMSRHLVDFRDNFTGTLGNNLTPSPSFDSFLDPRFTTLDGSLGFKIPILNRAYLIIDNTFQSKLNDGNRDVFRLTSSFGFGLSLSDVY